MKRLLRNNFAFNRVLGLLAIFTWFSTYLPLPGQSIGHQWMHFEGRTNKLMPSEAAKAQGDFPLSCINFDWNSGPDIWDTASQTIFTYNPNGLMVQRMIGIYGSGNYFNDFRETREYDASGNDTLTVADRWNGSNWDPSYRFKRTFDPFGNLTSSIGQTWNGIGWDTSSGYRAIYTYHASNQIASVIQEQYQTGTGWYPTYKMAYSLDQLNRWDTVTGYLPVQGTWANDRRIVGLGWHDFSKNQPDSGRFEIFTTVWENLERYRVTYSQYDSQEWIYEKFALAWDSTDQYILQYDIHGNEVLSESYRWNGTWSQLDGLRTTITYGTGGEKLEVIQELFNGVEYVNDSRQLYADFFTETEAVHPTIQGVKAFPNPANATGQLHLQLDGKWEGPLVVCIYDAAGSLRLKANFPAQPRITLEIPEGLESGAYSYKIMSRSGIANGKVILLR